MTWPTHKIAIEEFGWSIVVYDLSVSEVKAMDSAMKADSPDLNSICESLLPSIKSWDFTDRNGDPIPLDNKGLGYLPAIVIKELIQGILNMINREPFPKVESIIE